MLLNINQQPGHADAYANLKITWIAGRIPTLYIRDDSDKLLEEIDLTSVS